MDPNVRASDGQIPSTEQFSHNPSEEVNVQGLGAKRETGPAFGSRSAVDYRTSAPLVPGQGPEHYPYVTLTPSKVKPWDKITSTPMSSTSASSSSGNANPNIDSHAPPFPIPSYLKPQSGMSLGMSFRPL